MNGGQWSGKCTQLQVEEFFTSTLLFVCYVQGTYSGIRRLIGFELMYHMQNANNGLT